VIVTGAALIRERESAERPERLGYRLLPIKQLLRADIRRIAP
jgi:hypothetical protein